MLPRQDQLAKFSHYQSLDLANKIYQLKTLRLIKKYLSVAKSRVLELGSADDSFLKLVCDRTGGSGTGLDITKGHDLEQTFPVAKKSFDLAIALEIIEHLYDTDHFLAQIHASLKPRGILILSTPNLASLPNRLRLLFGGYPKYLEYNLQGAGHIHLYTLPTLQSQLTKLGFKIVTATSPNFLCPFITKSWFPSLLKEFCLFLGDLLPQFGSHLLIVARK